MTQDSKPPELLTASQIDDRWPILATLQRAIQWHADGDADWFLKLFTFELKHYGDRLDLAEAELKNLPTHRTIKIMQMENSETDPIAPNACTTLTSMNC